MSLEVSAYRCIDACTLNSPTIDYSANVTLCSCRFDALAISLSDPGDSHQPNTPGVAFHTGEARKEVLPLTNAEVAITFADVPSDELDLVVEVGDGNASYPEANGCEETIGDVGDACDDGIDVIDNKDDISGCKLCNAGKESVVEPVTMMKVTTRLIMGMKPKVMLMMTKAKVVVMQVKRLAMPAVMTVMIVIRKA